MMRRLLQLLGLLALCAAGLAPVARAADAPDVAADPALEARVVAKEQQAWDLNISGVPAMIVEGKFLIPGAQAPEVYVNALRRVAEKTGAAAPAN